MKDDGGDARRTAEIAAAVRRERERLAEALHDDALQRVLVVHQDLVEADEENDAALRKDVRRQLSELAGALRATTRAMHDGTLDELPLAPALDRLAADAARQGRLAVASRVALEATGANDRFVRTLAGELLANAVKHADASRIDIEVTRQDETIVLVVGDDGRGFDVAELERAARAGHLGHARLRRTMAAIGGTVTIDSVPGAGTTITCRMPDAALRTQRTLEEALARERDGADGPPTLAGGAEAGARIVSRLGALRGEASQVAEGQGLDAFLSDVARLVAEELGWSVLVHRHRPSPDDLVVAAGHGVDPTTWEFARGTADSAARWEGLLDPRFERRGGYLVPDGAVRPARSAASSDENAWRAGDDLFVPFRSYDGRLLGVLSLHAPRSGRRPTELELDVLVAVAGHVGLVVEQADAALDGAARTRNLERLLAVAAELTVERDPAAVPARAAAALSEILGFDRVIVECADADGLLRPCSGDAPNLSPLSRTEAEYLLGAVGSDVPRLFAGEDDRAVLPASRRMLLEDVPGRFGPRAWREHLLLAPLTRAGGGLSGLIWLDRPRDGLLPDERTLRVLGAFAGQVAAALSGAWARAQLERTSGRDELTQLADRHAFTLELEREVARAARTGLASTLVLCAVDGCPELGDDAPPLGPLEHEAWRETSAAFDDELRRGDRAFRIAGDLFAFLLVGSGRPPEIAAVTVRIAARLRSIARREGLGIRFGSAEIGSGTGDAEAVLAHARRQLADGDRATA